MVNSSKDLFIVTSLTTLGMAENLMCLLNTVIGNLPVGELMRICNTMEHSVHIADNLLLGHTMASHMDTLSLSNSVCLLWLSVMLIYPEIVPTILSECTSTPNHWGQTLFTL
jgi:hypothetical protein